MASPTKITLISIDGKRFEVEKAAAMLSQTLKNMIDDDCAEGDIPISNVSSEILAKVIEYCNKHAKSSEDDDLSAWDAEFVKVDESTLLELVSAANYLYIKDLLDWTCQAVAKMIEDKSPEEVRELFNITNDFTPEEEEAIRKENAWAFE